MAERNVDFNLNAHDNTKRAFTSLNQSLKNTSRTLQVIQGPLGPIAGRFSAMSTALGTLNPALLAFSAATTGAIFAVTKGIREFSETERQLLQLEAQLKATGFAAGQSTGQLEEMAQKVARATLASLDEVRTAQGILLSFRTISGDVFGRTLEAAQNLAAAGFGSITDASKQLGKALEDPITGLSSLRRAGVTFSTSQQDVIKGLIETGQRAEAMGMILDGIEKQVGGAGAAGGSGVAGAFDSLAQSTENFWVALGDTATGEWFKEWINSAAEGIQGLADSMASIDSASMGELTNRLREAYQEIQDAEGDLADIRRRNEENTFVKNPTAAAEARVRAAREEYDWIVKQFSIRKAAATAAKEQADAAQEQIAKEEALGFAAEKNAKFQKQFAKDQKRRLAEEEAAIKKYLRELDAVVAKADPMRALLTAQRQELELMTENYGDQTDLVEGLKAAHEEEIEALKKKTDEVNEAAKKIGESFEDAFIRATLEAEKLSDVVDALLKDIAEAIIRQTITQPIASAIGSGLSAIIPIPAFASGGTTPGGPVLVGEKGPEILTPPAGSRITPNKSIGGDVNIQVVNNASPDVQVDTQEDVTPDGNPLIRFIVNTVAQDMANGGVIGRTMNASYGARMQGIRR